MLMIIFQVKVYYIIVGNNRQNHCFLSAVCHMGYECFSCT